MALAKFLRGKEENLSNQPLHDGYIWVTHSDGILNMHIDYIDESGTLVRNKLSSEYAEKLKYLKDGETVEIEPSSLIGRSTENNGEIFNDYENNKSIASYGHAEGYNTQVGTLAFSLKEHQYSDADYTNAEKTIGKYYLNTVEGIAVNMPYTIVLTNNYDYRGKVISVGEDYIEVDNYLLPNSDTGSTIKSSSYILFPENPEIQGDNIIGDSAHAEGCDTHALSKCSHAEGYNTIAAGKYAHAENRGSIAGGYNSHAEGGGKAYGFASHAETEATTLVGAEFAHAEGRGSVAGSQAAHAEGYETQALNRHSHAEGNSTIAEGGISHAEGSYTKASGFASHAEGSCTETRGSASHAEGSCTVAQGNDSHAEGFKTSALGESTHAEGSCTKTSGYASHAEGYNTSALGDNSHAEGNYTNATGLNSHAEGIETKTQGYASHAEGNGTRALGENAHAEGYNTYAQGYTSHAEGSGTVAEGIISHAEGKDTHAIGNQSHVEGTGSNTTINGQHGHAEGYYSSVDALGAHAEGYRTVASGKYAHAEGSGTKTQGYASHAEGYNTSALGENAHAEGNYTNATGSTSHAEGQSCLAAGKASHAEGLFAKAFGEAQHVQGRYNIEDTENKYAHIVGNGTSVTGEDGKEIRTLSNAHTLDWEGNAWFAGDIVAGDVSLQSLMPTVITSSESTIVYNFSNRKNKVSQEDEIISISFDFGNEVYDRLYGSELSFDSGATPTSVDYAIPEEPTQISVINWVGVDCASDSYINDNGETVPISIFQPSANTHYDMVFYFNGKQFIGLVNGYVPAGGNGAV